MAVKSRYAYSSIGFASGILLTLGSLLDWSGVEYSSGVDRALAFVAGALMLVLAAVALIWRPRVIALGIVSGVLGLNMGVVNLRDINDKSYEYAAYPDASVGIGIYLVIVGGALALLLGLVAFIPRGWLRRRP